MPWTPMAALEAREGYIHYAIGELNARQEAFARQVYKIKDLPQILEKQSNLQSAKSAMFFGKKDAEWMSEILAAQGDFIARVQ